MPLTAVLQQWLDAEEWQDEIEIDDDRKNSSLVTKFVINDQAHRLFLEAHEETKTFCVYLYSPFNVPPARIADMVRILNRINFSYAKAGRLACNDDKESNPVQFQRVIVVEGSSLVPKQIGVMASEAVDVFNVFGELLAAIALTKQPVEDLWSNHIEEMQKEEEAEQVQSPTEL